MGGKQSHSKTSKKKSKKFEKGTTFEEEPSKEYKQEYKRTLRKSSSSKFKEKKRCSASVPTSFKHLGSLPLGAIRRSKSWAIEV